MKAAAKEQFGSDSLHGKKIAIQGVGHVGEHLVNYVTKEGAKVFVTDIHENQLNHIHHTYGSTVVGLNEIYDLDCDIYAPCALGATLNDDTLNRLKCGVIAGAANNQLAIDTIHGQRILEKGIIYAPDYALNAGGVISCYSEVKGLSHEWVMQKSEEIYGTIQRIVQRSIAEKTPTHIIADKLAEERIISVGSIKLPL
jgi:leucine dehydrogenase